MFSDRIGQAIAHECEWELLDLAAYMGALLLIGHADQERNPLRPEIDRQRAVRGHREPSRPSARRASCSRASSAR